MVVGQYGDSVYLFLIMKSISIIPARGGSKGIPKKNLIKLNGKPLIYYTITASLNSKIDRTIVSTDDKTIFRIAKKLGAEVILRPKTLAKDKIKIEPVIKHTLEFLKNENYTPDTIVLLQNTSPLRNSIHINQALKLFKKHKTHSVLSGFLSHYFVWEKKDNHIIPLNYNPLKRPNRQQMKHQFIENGAIYITPYNNFIKTKCRISGKINMYEMSELSSIQIDSTNDLKYAELILKGRFNETN
jgi:CMP-N,N'-diacetyllegionaminic acid synthase